SEAEPRRQLDANAAGHDLADDVAGLHEAEIEIAGDVVAEAVRAGSVDRDPVALGGEQRLADVAFADGFAGLPRKGGGESEVHRAAHRALLAEEFHFLPLRVRAVEPEVDVEVVVGRSRLSE